MKLVITQGCPGSGKSTYAKELCRTGFVRVERDELRRMLFGLDKRTDYKFSKERETLVTSILNQTVAELLKTNSVIVSDTNLNPNVVQHFKELAKQCNAEFELKVFDVAWEDLVKRNKYRGSDAVPIDVLRNMYNKMNPWQYKPDPDLPKAVIFDLDGTLAIHQRGPYEFHKCDTDLVDTEVLKLLNKYKTDHKILIFSGRDEGSFSSIKIKSEQWLKDNGIHYDAILLRKHGDRRKDSVVKKEMLLSMYKKFNIVLAVDDRQQVVDMWRRIGLKTFQVNYGDF